MLKRNKGDILYLSNNKRIRYPSRIYDGESSFITAFSKNNLPSTLGSIGQFINTAVDTYKDNSSVKDMSGQKAIIEQQLNNSFDTSNNTESLLNQFNSTNWLNSDYEGKDLKNATTGQQIGNTISSTLQGASTGATIGGPWGCVCKGTRVITNDGRFVNIEDLKNSDGIIGYDNNEISHNNIHLNDGEAYKECVRISLDNNEYLECSIDHPVYASNSGRAKRYIINNKRIRVKEYSYIKAENLKIGDNVAIIDEIPIFGNYYEKDAYLIGLLIGDGSYDNKHGVRLYSSDKSTWDFIESNYNNTKHIESFNKYSKEFRRYNILNFSEKMKLLKLLGNLKDKKRLPSIIYTWNKESIANLLAGLFDTDGYITVEKNNKYRICFCQSNLTLLKEVKEQLLKFGVHSYIKTNPKKSTSYKGHKINSKKSYVLIIKDSLSSKKFIENIKLNISYKKENLNKIYNIIKSKKRRDNSYIMGIKSSKITKIEPIGIRRIYNLEALNSHNYIANGVITHNSLAGGIIGAGASIGGIIVGNKKAKNLAAELNTQSILGNTNVINKFNNATLSTIDNMYKDLYGNVAAYGGNLNMDIPNYQTHGGDFSNGIIKINEGGTHEENPNGGVLMGVDSQGVPNLVEEGEVIYNDYVFSNRLTPSNDLLKKVKLPKKYKGKSYSYIAEDLSKESEETPNDPISKRGLQANMSKLATLQELQRQSMGKQGTNQLIKGNTAAFGGRIYDGLEDTLKLANREIDNSIMGLMPVDNSKMKFPGVTYNDTSTIIPKSTNSTTSKTKESSLPTYLRYAPVLSSGIAALNSLLQKPDYENADILKDLASNVPNNRVRFNKIYNSYNYKPIDSDYLLNQVKAQAGATNSAILNSNANAGTALSALLSSGYNAQKGVGNAIMQAENLNNERRRTAAQMQTAVDQYNSQGLANADSQNANLALQQANMRNTLLSNYASMRENIDNALEQSRSLNLTNFTDNLGNIGRENVNWNYLQNLIDSGYFNVLNKNMRYNKEGKVIAKYGGKIKRKK